MHAEPSGSVGAPASLAWAAIGRHTNASGGMASAAPDADDVDDEDDVPQPPSSTQRHAKPQHRPGRYGWLTIMVHKK
jgi:hypothetical protein